MRQQENEDFDPEDMNYNTFRWITTDRGFAMGPSRANPLTGEILDADIIFDASMVRFWKQEAQAVCRRSPRRWKEPASPIQAIRAGLGPAQRRGQPQQDELAGWNDRPNRSRTPAVARYEAAPAGRVPVRPRMKYELGIGRDGAGRRGAIKRRREASPEELIGQAIKEVMMHEVGHTLGLRHNSRPAPCSRTTSSTTRPSRATGPGRLGHGLRAGEPGPKGVKQGDYFTTTLGPYDYWAIEYAYKPLSGGTDGEVAELKKIASACATPGHDYGTDEDMFGTADPLINVWDLGADPMKFGQDRMLLAEELLKTLADKTVDKGEGYQRTRQAFSMLLQQYGNAAYLMSQLRRRRIYAPRPSRRPQRPRSAGAGQGATSSARR